MQVRIRTFDETESRSCGEMNPEQLENFVNNIQMAGIYNKEDNELLNPNIVVIYKLDYNSFYAEIILEDSEK